MIRKSIKDEFDYIDNFFDNLSREELVNQLVDCGLVLETEETKENPPNPYLTR